MFKELQLFPSRKQKVPSLIYSKEELEQQLKESARLKRSLRKAGLYQLESIPHDIFDVLRSDLPRPTLQNTPGELVLNPVTHLSAQNNGLNRVVNKEMRLDIDEYRAKRRKILESGKTQKTRQDQQNVEATVSPSLNQTTTTTTGQGANEATQTLPTTTPQQQVQTSQTATTTTATTTVATTTTAAVTPNTTTTTETVIPSPAAALAPSLAPVSAAASAPVPVITSTSTTVPAPVTAPAPAPAPAAVPAAPVTMTTAAPTTAPTTAIATPVTPATTTTTTTAAAAAQPPVINTADATLDTWYSPSETVAFPTYTYPTCWVPVFASHTQIGYCEAQSNVISDSAPQYNLAFDKTLEYLNYPLNRELVVEEETIAEIWSSSEKLKFIKRLLDALTKEDYCIAILTLDMDGESHLLELLQVTGYECDRISNVIVDDWDQDYGVVLWTDKSKQNEPFNGDVDTAFVMDARVLKKNTITGLRARSENSDEKIRLCYFVTIGSVEERVLRCVLRNKNLTDADLRRAVLAENEWPYEHDGNPTVLNNLLSWLRRNSNTEYTYRAKHELPGSTRVEASPLAGETTAPSSPMLVDSEPPAASPTALVPAPVSTYTSVSAPVPAPAPVSLPLPISEPQSQPATTTPTVAATPAIPGTTTATTTATVVAENMDASDMDVSSDEEGEVIESFKPLPKSIESYIENFLPKFIVNKVQPTFDDRQSTSITESEKSMKNNLEKELLQKYLKSANEAKEQFEKELEELRETYKKVAVSRAKEMYN